MELNSIIKIKYPIIQGGMVWCSGWRLASAVSSEGGLGLIGAGSMHPDVLRHHIRSCKEALKDAPDGFNIFGVNIPLVYPQLDEVMDIIVDEKVPIVFSSAGSPKKWTPFLHENGIKVAHVISSSAFALKCVEAEVDIIVAEGFEAGGHNGKEETTTFCLIPAVRRTIGPDFPLLAAGGIATREQMKAAMVLGADGVQIGTRFALCEESSASEAFKNYCRGLAEGKTKLLLKKVVPTRLADNDFSFQIAEEEGCGAVAEELKVILGTGRAKKGIFEGDLSAGEIEIGQVCSLVNGRETVSQIFNDLIKNE